MSILIVLLCLCQRTNLSNFFLLRNCSTGHLITHESHPTSHRSHMYHMGVVLAVLIMERMKNRTFVFMSAPTTCVCSTDGSSVVVRAWCTLKPILQYRTSRATCVCRHGCVMFYQGVGIVNMVFRMHENQTHPQSLGQHQHVTHNDNITHVMFL